MIGYTPNADYNGSDAFDVQVSDGNGGTATITVNVTIEAVNDAPLITEGTSTSVTMSEDGAPTAFNLTLNATDADLTDTLTWSVSSAASQGTATASGTGASQVIGYTPNADYNGSDAFDVQVSDGNGGTATITVNVTIEAVNDAPLITGQSVLSTPQNTALAITLADLTVTDVDNIYPTDFSLTVLAGSNYTFVGDTITPATDYNGTLTVPVKVNDGLADSNTFDLSVSVTPPACFTLTSGVVPVGSGSIETDIPENCTGGYTQGTVVQLTAVPNTGYTFASWSGDVIDTANPVSVTMDGNKTVTATFTQLTGTSVSQWASGATASSQYSSTSWGAVQATGVPDTNSCGDRSTAWSPSTSGSGAEWLKATYAQTVYATGLRVHETYQAGFITGIDLLEPDGTVHALSISPDSTPCAGYYELTFAETPYLVNAIVVHTAKSGYEEIDAVELTGVADTYVPPEYTLTINQVGNGTITADVSAPYHAGDVVHLTAAPGSGWTFSDWSGDVIDTANPVSVTMDGNKTVTATFTQLTGTSVSQWASGATASSQYSSTSWGAVQATGVPDTNSCGDRSTAWSPSTSGLGAEWLKATYAQTMYATGLRVHETYQAGFITGIDLLEPDGTVHALSISPDSTPCAGYYELTFAETPYLVNAIVVHTAKSGYEEIDAVELTGVADTYVPPEYTLTINQVGNGTITADVSAPYHAGDVVQLTAAPGSGYTFSDWSGDVIDTANPVSVTMDGNKTVTATFTQLTGTSVSQWASGATASSQYSSTSWGAVQATGVPDTNSCGDRSTAWSPSTSGLGAEWLKATYAQTVYATGLRVHETYQAGFITGIDLLEPDGTVHALSISPDSTPCAGYYELTFAETPYLVNAIVVHTAKSGYEEIDAVELTGVADTYVPPEYTLTINQVGNGTITADVSAPYHAGDVVHLTAAPGSGWTFSDWSGDVIDTANPVSVTMDGNKTVTATFTQLTGTSVSQWASGATASSQYSSTSWGAVQATGVPDTNSCGDRSTAWSPSTSGSGAEWLKATYAQTMYATGLRVHETYQAGFITGIDLLEPDGTVHALSISPDSTPCAGYYELTFAETPYLVNAIVVHTAKSGYEEIDAVELTGIPSP